MGGAGWTGAERGTTRFPSSKNLPKRCARSFGRSALPYSMPTTVARSGTVTSASAVVMKVPCAMVFASPLYW